jgi:glycosyltransferase involved in cell wall biosynthesis
VKISVVIPVKNRANLIGQTLHSVFAQTLQPFEVIVVDDHSTDDLKGALSEFGNKVTLLTSDGTGPGAARNKGLKHASGNAIQFLDSDDLLSRNKFQVQAKLLKDTSADFAYGPYVKAIEEKSKWRQIDVVMQYHPLPGRSLKNLVLEGWCLTQTILFNKQFLNKVGWWREDLMTHEDYEYGLRISLQASKYVHENETCVLYRQHQAQLTDQTVMEIKRARNLEACLKIMQANINFKPVLHSLLMFYGNAASNKQFLSKMDKEVSRRINLKEYFCLMYRRLVTKYELTKTKTGWSRIYGTSNSKDLFAAYLSLFEN